MMDDGPPSDFDWVTARHKCSVAYLFQTLLERAKQNVATMNALHKASGGREDAYVHDTVPGVFSVVRGVPGGGPPHTVRFNLDSRDETITVDAQGVPSMEPFTGSLTLNEKGQCRLKVGPEQLDEWQVLRRALEPLFFGLKEWQI
jgi:hypothetical protein